MDYRFLWKKQYNHPVSQYSAAHLRNTFGDRIISRSLWTARSPYLTHCDCYLCGSSKDDAYKNNLYTQDKLSEINQARSIGRFQIRTVNIFSKPWLCRWTPRWHEISHARFNLADLLISPLSFVIMSGLLITFILNNRAPHCWRCLRLYSLNTTHCLQSRPLYSSALTLQGETCNTLPYSDWSDSERVLLSLADQFKNSKKISLNFRARKIPTT